MKCQQLKYETIENPHSPHSFIHLFNASINVRFSYVNFIESDTRKYWYCRQSMTSGFSSNSARIDIHAHTYTITNAHLIYFQCVWILNARVLMHNTKWWHFHSFHMLMVLNGNSRYDGRTTEMNFVQLKSKSNNNNNKKKNKNMKNSTELMKWNLCPPQLSSLCDILFSVWQMADALVWHST